MKDTDKSSDPPLLHADPAYLVALAGLESGRAEAKPLDPARCSIAVLPFDNMSADRGQEYFADGIAEDLLTELARHRHLAVVSRNSSFVYKGKAVNAQTAGRELGADFILEGSVRKGGNRVRITAQLIDCKTGLHAWAERYDRQIEDIFALQDEIVTAILGGLSFNLTEAAATRRQSEPTASSSAYTAFLQGRAAWRSGDEAKARSHFHQAINLDPRYAPSLSYLSFLYAFARFSASSTSPPDELLKVSEDFAARAIAAGSDNPFVLHRLADAKLMNGEPLMARQLAEQSRRMTPHDIESMFSVGLALSFCGEHAAGLSLMEAAFKREARLPIGFALGLADGYYLSGDYAAAVRIYDSLLERPPYVELLRAASLAQSGRVEESRHCVSEAKAGFQRSLDAVQFARNVAAMCALPADAERWLEGYRKAGIAV